jgi:hypothetical protein
MIFFRGIVQEEALSGQGQITPFFGIQLNANSCAGRHMAD